MKLYESGEDYLEAVLMLQKKNGMVRSVDLARHMEVSKPSVCHAVASLRDGGFLTMDEDHFLHLTDIGREVAETIYERHCFFTEQLIAAGVDPRQDHHHDCPPSENRPQRRSDPCTGQRSYRPARHSCGANPAKGPVCRFCIGQTGGHRLEAGSVKEDL